jgi:3-deoxy-D-manno-octulosonic-acid transferase
MARLLDDFAPDRILVVKWDLWPSLMGEARRRSIPVFLLGAALSSKSGRSRWPGRLLARPLHRMLSGIGAASQSDAENFRRLGVADNRLTLTGDTRFDRVIQRSHENRPHLLNHSIHPREFCLVAGSTWPAEENLIWDAYPRILAKEPTARLLLAPHEPSEGNLLRLEAEAARRGLPTARLSTLDHFPEACVVLADVLGQLAELYKLGSLALVGGGFGDGVHSVLEAAAHGLPVIMGPRIERAAEAAELIAAGAGWIVQDPQELLDIWIRHLSDAAFAQENAHRARLFVDSGAGAAGRSLDFIENFEI